jgi:cyclophilin family peptidyl-prolyl cis-trans isomerase
MSLRRTERPRCTRWQIATIITPVVALALGATTAFGGVDMAEPRNTVETRDGAPRVALETTKGDILVELFPEEAPKTVANFLAYVDEGFYDGTIFHRVIAGFVVQGGGYDVAMNYRQPRGNVPNESHNGLSNDRGTIAMARQNDPHSASSQFYFNLASNPHLNAQPGRPGYTVFGRVIDGMEVLDRIEMSTTVERSGMSGVPDEPVVIERARRME